MKRCTQGSVNNFVRPQQLPTLGAMRADVFLRAQKSRTPKNSPDLGPDHTSFSGQRNPQYSGSGADRPGLGELERVSVAMRGQDFSDCMSGASGPGTDGDFSLQPVRLALEGIDSPRSKLRIGEDA